MTASFERWYEWVLFQCNLHICMPCTVHDLQRGTCYDAIIIIQMSFGHKTQVRGCRLANCHSSTVRLTVSDIVSWSNITVKVTLMQSEMFRYLDHHQHFPSVVQVITEVQKSDRFRWFSVQDFLLRGSRDKSESWFSKHFEKQHMGSFIISRLEKWFSSLVRILRVGYLWDW